MHTVPQSGALAVLITHAHARTRVHRGRGRGPAWGGGAPTPEMLDAAGDGVGLPVLRRTRASLQVPFGRVGGRQRRRDSAASSCEGVTLDAC